MTEIILKYDGEKVGEVITNQSLTLTEIIRLCGIDLDSQDPYGEPWDWELFSTDDDDEG